MYILLPLKSIFFDDLSQKDDENAVLGVKILAKPNQKLNLHLILARTGHALYLQF